MTLEKLKNGYITLAILVFNTLLLCLCLNGGFLLWSKAKPESLAAPTKPPDTRLTVAVDLSALSYGMEPLRQVYPEMTDPQIIRLLFENTEVSFLMCDDDMRFREKPFEGYFFHVDAAGFRWNKARPVWPPQAENVTIFVFGGSTTFGYGEADANTIPASLQNQLISKTGSDKIVVYNFGHYNFFSLQEKWAFQALLDDGFIPDAAIFIDGLNDSWHWNGIPWDGSQCAPQLNQRQRIINTLRCDYGEFCLPMQKIHLDLEQQSAIPTSAPYPPATDEVTNRAILDRWLKNKAEIEALAAEHDIQTLFIIQPVPTYAYDLSHHLFATTLYDFGAYNRSFYMYELWEDLFADPQVEWTHNTLDLAHLGEDNSEPIYVDKFHYTAPFMDEMAGVIADSIVERGWVQ